MSNKEQMEKIIHEKEKVFQLSVTFIFKPPKYGFPEMLQSMWKCNYWFHFYGNFVGQNLRNSASEKFSETIHFYKWFPDGFGDLPKVT